MVCKKFVKFFLFSTSIIWYSVGMPELIKKTKPQSRLQSSRLFIREFLRNPTKIGAIAPSSRVLAREIVRLAQVAESQIIVEYGAGTGAFTEEILRRKKPEASFLAIESNPALVSILRERFPQLVILENSVEETPRLLRQFQFTHADSIVSGLPWSSFSEDLQDRLLQATLEALRPGGVFATFAYLTGLMLPSGIAFRRKIKTLFRQVRISPAVWRNLPPAIIYQCIR
jgi:phospholipid N-methyltransferase